MHTHMIGCGSILCKNVFIHIRGFVSDGDKSATCSGPLCWSFCVLPAFCFITGGCLFIRFAFVMWQAGILMGNWSRPTVLIFVGLQPFLAVSTFSTSQVMT